jgi:hypothetical protein
MAAVTLLVAFAWRSLSLTPPLGRGRRQEPLQAVVAASRDSRSSLVTPPPPERLRQDDAPWARRLPDGVHAEYHVVHGDSTVSFINAVAATRWADPCPCAMIVTTLASTAAHVADEVLPWIAYHTDIGFRWFFILWDGTDEAARARLTGLNHVTLLRVTPGPGYDADAAQRFATFEANHWQWRGRPGNYVLMVRQGFAVNEAIRRAKVGALPSLSAATPTTGGNLSDAWLFHLDVDEAWAPMRIGGRASVPPARTLPAMRVESALARLHAGVTSVRFLNWEGVPPHAHVVNRLAEVTVFKAHGRHVDPRVWRTYSDQLRPPGHPEWPVFLLYGNGKPAARLSVPFLRQWGPHFFRGGTHPLQKARRQQQQETRRRRKVHGDDEAALQQVDDDWVYASDDEHDDDVDEGDEEQQDTGAGSAWNEVESDAAVVLHYPYARYSDLRDKAARSSCPFAAAAAAGNRTALEACYVMGFDVDVALAAAAHDSNARLAALFGARIALPPDVVATHLATGLLRECLAPAALLASHARDIQWLANGWLAMPPSARVQVEPQSSRAADAAAEDELEYLKWHM